jgi:cytochrome o ubiquinol oxidase operon protein cyoD
MNRDSKDLSTKPYVFGFVASLIFTLSAYLVIAHRLFNRRVLIATITVLAFAQFVVQLMFFLHLGRETKPRWKQLVFWMMIMVVSILVFGSIWIMNNLNYHMSLQQMYQYLNNQGDGL